MHSFRTPEYEEGKEGHLEQKRAKEDSDALIQRSHFLVTSVIISGRVLGKCPGGHLKIIVVVMPKEDPSFRMTLTIDL